MASAYALASCDDGRASVSNAVTLPRGQTVAERRTCEQVGDGDPRSERMGEVISVVEPGKADPGQEQIFAYGTRAGLWRMADCLRRYQIPATIFFCRFLSTRKF